MALILNSSSAPTAGGLSSPTTSIRQCQHRAEAIAAYIHARKTSPGLCIGYDTRFGSKAFAGACAEVAAPRAFRSMLANDITPTPALSFGVPRAQGGPAAS